MNFLSRFFLITGYLLNDHIKSSHIIKQKIPNGFCPQKYKNSPKNTKFPLKSTNIAGVLFFKGDFNTILH